MPHVVGCHSGRDLPPIMQVDVVTTPMTVHANGCSDDDRGGQCIRSRHRVDGTRRWVIDRPGRCVRRHGINGRRVDRRRIDGCPIEGHADADHLRLRSALPRSVTPIRQTANSADFIISVLFVTVAATVLAAFCADCDHFEIGFYPRDEPSFHAAPSPAIQSTAADWPDRLIGSLLLINGWLSAAGFHPKAAGHRGLAKLLFRRLGILNECAQHAPH